MSVFLVWCHRLICIVLSRCEHACKEVCDVKQGIDPYPLLARSCDRWWPDFVTFTACKRSIFGLKRGKKAQCVSNRCKDLFKRKKSFGVMGTLSSLIIDIHSFKRTVLFTTAYINPCLNPKQAVYLLIPIIGHSQKLPLSLWGCMIKTSHRFY